MIVDGWFDWATKDPATLEKTYQGITNSLEAVFFHSAVGTYQGTINVVKEWPQPTNPRSVTAVVDESGETTQFYPVTACPWANASREWNTKGIGIEFAGGYNGQGHRVDEPITDPQMITATRLLIDLAQFKGVDTSYWQRPTTLKEHREVYATACPSGRIRWADIVAGFVIVPTKIFLYGDEQGGMEKRGKQQVQWNEGVEIWAYGDVAGNAVGQTWHNVGGVWQKVAE